MFERKRLRRWSTILGFAAGVIFFSLDHAAAETLRGALMRAYSTNPELNAQRARQRVIDEGVPQALGTYRPQVFGSADLGAEATRSNISGTGGAGSGGLTGGGGSGSDSETNVSGGFGVTVQQDIFAGFRRSNGVKEAESTVLSGREALRNTEQNVLLSAVEAYMNVLRDIALVRLNENSVGFLDEEFGAANDRFEVGEVTRTDVAQAEAAVALARSDLSLARANLSSSRATYAQIIGTEPNNLEAGAPIDRLLPGALDPAVAMSRERHPAILSASLLADASQYTVKTIEGELLPTVSLEGNLSRRYTGSGDDRVDSASLIGRVNVPIYQGGIVSSRVRQSKEEYGQRLIELDLAREQVEAAVISAWGGLRAAESQIEASQVEVGAVDIALAGVREEARVGQRTTLDVLESQQNLVDAQVRLITAQRDRVVASYSLLAAIGKLSAESLDLEVRVYEPEVYYEAVRDKWFGLRTPTGQ